MTLGVAVCVRSMLGSSVISTLPYVFETAGKQGLGVPKLTIGQYTYIMNGVLVLGQILVLRKKFESVQLFQLLVGFVFGSLIDLNMLLTTWLAPVDLWQKVVSQVLGCSILCIGIALEVRCGCYHARRGLSCSCEPYDRYRISEGEDLCRLLVGYLGSHLLIHLLRCLAVVHRGHRYLVCHGVCGHGGEEGRQPSRLVRPHLGISARLQKICLRFGKILVQAEVTGIDIVNAIYKRYKGMRISFSCPYFV